MKVILSLVVLLLFTPPVLAQGPPVNTDTPVMLGLQGGGIRTFAKFVHQSTHVRKVARPPEFMEQEVSALIAPVAIPYNLFDDKFQVGVVIPFMNVNVSQGRSDLSSLGVGDVRLFAKYLFYQFDRRNKTIRVASKAGVKLPTGDDDSQPSLGTGSTDYFFATVAGWIQKRVGIYIEGIYNVNTSNGPVDFGNSVSYNLALGYRLLPAIYETYPSPQLNGYLEINGTSANKNTVGSVTDENSGGTTVFLSPGIQYVGGRRWLLESSLQIPIVEEPNGTQVSPDWAFLFGTRVLIF